MNMSILDENNEEVISCYSVSEEQIRSALFDCFEDEIFVDRLNNVYTHPRNINMVIEKLKSDSLNAVVSEFSNRFDYHHIEIW